MVERVGSPSGGPLVNTTKLRASSFSKNGRPVEKNEENTGLSRQNEERFLRYQMQAAAKHILPNHRVGICLRHQIQKFGDVDLYKHRSTQRAFYGGLMVCGNGWVCPVCAAKIAERRRAELDNGFKIHLEDGGYCTMLTLTFSHSAKDKLKDLLDGLSEATQVFARDSRYKRFRSEIGLIGNIRAFEVTHGVNGWHPHIHMLLMHTVEIESWEWHDVEDTLYRLWSAALARQGMTASRAHGLKMDDAEEASYYIGKWGDVMKKRWGTDSEMTKANTKRGREGSMTPFDFLRAVAEDGDLGYVELFQEYAKAIKGKTQLRWSPGLKDRFRIEDKTDEEVATEKIEEADWLGSLGWQDWRYIVRNNLRLRLLEQIEQDGFEDAIHNLGIRKSPSSLSEE